MAVTTTVVGSYPKPPREGEPFKVRKTLHAIERGEATAADLQTARDELATEIIKEHEEAGISIVTDGHARWDDLLTPFAANITGFEIGPLFRWFDNNVYYRRPVCNGPIGWTAPASVEAFRFAVSATDRPVKAVLPGPITFARCSLDEHYYDHGAFVGALSSAIAAEAAALEAAGARYIQIDEPALLDAPEDLELARQTLTTITGALSDAETTLATYFSDAKRLGSEFFTLPVDVFGLDFVAGPENLQLLEDIPTGKGLQAGVIDSRNTRLESSGALRALIEKLAAAVGGENLRVSPSAGLEFLPREKAEAKLGLLGRVATEVTV